ncbi:MAG: hypothetical protein P8Y05_10260, partial [Deinococcales bacterium]
MSAPAASGRGAAGRGALVGVALVAALGLLLLLAPSFLFDTSFRLGVARTAFSMAGLVATWSLLAGIAGQFSFAHVALA